MQPMFFIFNVKSYSQAGRRRLSPVSRSSQVKIKLAKRRNEELQSVAALLALGFVLSAGKIEYTNGSSIFLKICWHLL
jgi:hypothetical protein